jgi:hypothetical protein
LRNKAAGFSVMGMRISPLSWLILALPLLGAAAVLVALWATEKPHKAVPPDTQPVSLIIEDRAGGQLAAG